MNYILVICGAYGYDVKLEGIHKNQVFPAAEGCRRNLIFENKFNGHTNRRTAMSGENIIGLITDFGNDDMYVGVVKGVIYGVNSRARIVDISHGVASYSVTNGQYCLYSSYRYFPRGTVFFVIVDPGVGSRRRAIVARDRGYIFVAPDNGILDAVLTASAEVFTLREGQFGDISATFHGRDVFAPASAMLAMGADPQSFGDSAEGRVRKPFPMYGPADGADGAAEGAFKGSVVHVDKFGNVITSFPNDLLSGGNGFLVRGAWGVFSARPVCTFSDLRKGEAGVISGSSGLIEIALQRASLAERYGIHIDDSIVMRHG